MVNFRYTPQAFHLFIGGTLLLFLLALNVWAGVPKKMPLDHIRGEELYGELCWQCHGKQGLGNGPHSKALEAPALAGKFQSKQYHKLINLIQNGKGKMPAYEQVIDRHDSKRILQWLARLDSKTGVDKYDNSKKKKGKKNTKDSAKQEKNKSEVGSAKATLEPKDASSDEGKAQEKSVKGKQKPNKTPKEDSHE